MRLFSALSAALLFAAASASAQVDRPLPPGFNPQRHMLVSEVEPGMVGFGRTVYNGVKIETFDVEVISVERGFAPGKSVVWIRCTDDRMQKLGPVSGMSGSPIYLWPKGEEKTGRDNARMLGAFAYGYGGGNGRDCYAGVQPIENMLMVGHRGDKALEAGEVADAGSGRGELIAHGMRVADQQHQPDAVTWRLQRLAEMLDIEPADPAAAPDLPGRRGRNTMTVPLMVGNAQQAAALAPFFKPRGITPMAGNAADAPAGLPPEWIAADQVQPQPGGVISIPLMTGDLDMPAIGTITEVLEDGTVLAFGHAFNGQGPIRVPMATGYVHFVQPSDSGSFKFGGTLRVVGSVINDESSAIAGKPGLEARYSPSHVETAWPDPSKNRSFDYQIADDDYYSPILAAYSVALSVASETELPDHATLRMQSKIKFSNGKSIDLDTVAPNATAAAVLYEIYPVIAALIDTPYGQLKFEGMDTTVTVQEKVMAAQIVDITIRNTTVEPGENLIVNLKLRPFRGEPFNHELKIKIPDDQPDGPFNVMIGDAASYTQLLMERKPHLTRITSLDELFEMVSMLSTQKTTAIYTTLMDNRKPQVAVGRTELPDLPSSKSTMLLQPTSTQATPYIDSVNFVEPIDYVVQGSFMFPILVQSQPEAGQ